ncbi:hypothetical protein QFZ64_000447 [Streptomyces sp. B3I8]|nr:hypothetical protein [Streptomyces sp. B3I8]
MQALHTHKRSGAHRDHKRPAHGRTARVQPSCRPRGRAHLVHHRRLVGYRSGSGPGGGRQGRQRRGAGPPHRRPHTSDRAIRLTGAGGCGRRAPPRAAACRGRGSHPGIWPHRRGRQQRRIRPVRRGRGEHGCPSARHLRHQRLRCPQRPARRPTRPARPGQRTHPAGLVLLRTDRPPRRRSARRHQVRRRRTHRRPHRRTRPPGHQGDPRRTRPHRHRLPVRTRRRRHPPRLRPHRPHRPEEHRRTARHGVQHH